MDTAMKDIPDRIDCNVSDIIDSIESIDGDLLRMSAFEYIFRFHCNHPERKLIDIVDEYFRPWDEHEGTDEWWNDYHHEDYNAPIAIDIRYATSNMIA